MVDSILFIVTFVAFCKLAIYFYNIYIARNYLVNKKELLGASATILILIPVIREQKVIINTLEHFMKFKCSDINIYIAIAGTSREKQVDDKLTTKQVVEQWIEKNILGLKNNVRDVFFSEVNECEGDRATQLNYAIRKFAEKYPDKNLDYVGVYDADSLPSLNTILEVTQIFNENKNISACQQPVSFTKSANRMAEEKKNPILVANAMFQTTWTMIRELPSWIKYGCSPADEVFKENVYLIGHGEFLRKSIYDQFEFPEFEITDGIQLGYRLGMSNKKIMALTEFCDDDVPQSIDQVMKQHKRWFGGCMNIFDAYTWSKNHFHHNAFLQMLDGYWSQFCWAYASLIMFVSLLVSILTNSVFSYFLVTIILVYSYLLPLLAHSILKDGIKVRLVDWLALPLAIGLKGIGPNLFIFDKLFKEKVTFVKVER